MANEPADVSVIVPTFNRAALLGATLDAILGQTSPPAEVIVIDDGSTDTTSEVLARFEQRVKPFRITNGGDLAARNHGLRAARGRLVAFCDSDDLWCPGFLAAMIALWQAEPPTRVAFANFTIIREDVWQAGDKFAEAPDGFWGGLRAVGTELAVFDDTIVDRLIGFQPFFPSCMVADRAFLMMIGGWDEAVGRIVGTDFATVLRVAEHAPFGIVRTPLVGIRKHGSNYSADVQATKLGEARILEHVLRTRPSLSRIAPLIEASIVARREQALHTAFSRRDYEAVRAIHASLPVARSSTKLNVKAQIAALPRPFRTALARLLLAFGSLRSAARQR